MTQHAPGASAGQELASPALAAAFRHWPAGEILSGRMPLSTRTQERTDELSAVASWQISASDCRQLAQVSCNTGNQKHDAVMLRPVGLGSNG